MNNTINFNEAKNKKSLQARKEALLKTRLVLDKLQKQQNLTSEERKKLEDYCKAMKLFAGLSMMRAEAKIDAYSLIENYVGESSLLYDSKIRHLFSEAYKGYLSQEEDAKFKI